MGQHKIPGASKGPNYEKTERGKAGYVRVSRYKDEALKPGNIISRMDGSQIYRIQPDGSHVRISEPVRPPEEPAP